MKKLTLLVLITVLMLAAVGVRAQDLSAGELEAVEDVSAALEALKTLDSYTATVDQTVDQEVTAGTVNQKTRINQSGDITAQHTESGGYNIEGTLLQDITINSGTQKTSVTMTMGLIIVDDVLYVRIDDASPALAPLVPDGWVNVNEDGADYQLLAGMNTAALNQLYELTYPVNEESVTSITKLDADEIDGQAMRVFEIEYDVQYLVDNGVLDTLASALASSAPGVDLRDLLTQMMDGATLTLKVWVGDDDDLIHHMENELSVDTTIEIQGQKVDLVQTSTATIDFSGFDEPIEIEAPETGT